MEIAETIITLLVGLVVFVTGMSMMSRGLKNAAGRQIRHLFKKIKDNRIAAAGIGMGTTAIIQSSGATMVMVMGFLSAGMLTFAQGMAVVFGALVGTTVTGLLVSLSTFSFSSFLMGVAFIGFILGFFKSPLVKNIGEILVGFGILFFGLSAMKSAFTQTDIQNAIVTLLNAVNFPLLLVLIGAALTAITQSSSATDGIVIVMVAANPEFLSSGIYLVIGATVGAMMPMIIASFKSDILAKRVCYSVLLTRIVYALAFSLILMAVQTPLMNWVDTFSEGNTGIILAIFTVIYNTINLLVFLPLITPLEKLSTKLIRDKDAEKKKKLLLHIDEHLFVTPSLATLSVKKEIEHMFALARENYFLGYEMMITQDLSRAKELEDREENIDYINNALSDYMIALSPKVNTYDEKKIGAYYHVINDIERIGDHAMNFLTSAREMKDAELSFSNKAKEEFDQMEDVIVKMFNLSIEVFDDKRKSNSLSELHKLETKTDELKVELSNAHFERIKNNQCDNKLSPYHSTFLSELERVADHLTNVGYSVINPTGDDEVHTVHSDVQ
ncbi:MAG: Na/Pi cotransporter family protein [Bacilli bacterium]|nr:Na/Pi cotransporter family protein [Bacilli bacterium]